MPESIMMSTDREEGLNKDNGKGLERQDFRRWNTEDVLHGRNKREGGI